MKRSLVLLFALIGCEGAHREHTDTDAGIDTPITCGSVTCDQIPAPSCEGTTLREHTAACNDATCSYPATEIECGAAGCCGDHCCSVAPSNADVTGTLMPTGLVIAPPNGTFDTDTDCTVSSALGTCSVVARIDLPDACVCRMDKLTIGTLDIDGSRALVILAHDSVRIEHALDVGGKLMNAGPGARGAVYTTRSDNGGGAGGSFASKGGRGGFGVMAADPHGDATLVPLSGGTNGMHGGWQDGGGGGGGAVQISAGVKIEIPGAILAGGGGGLGGQPTWGLAGGAGGGSGGAILLEAPTIIMTGRLDANGGGGGAGGGDDFYGNAGEDAKDDVPAGGTSTDSPAGCSLDGHIFGGHGGDGATSATPARNGQDGGYKSGCIPDRFLGGGGGGGGLGRIRINTVGGCQCNGTVSPNASFGTLGVQ